MLLQSEYLGDSFVCAVLERFGNIEGNIEYSRRDLEQFAVTRIEVPRPIPVVDITGGGLRRIGADGRLTTGSHRISREWAAALYEHPQRPRGIMYFSRSNQSLVSVALFDYPDVVASIEAGPTEPILVARGGAVADIVREHGVLLPDDGA